jgi:hypothetical protein
MACATTMSRVTTSKNVTLMVEIAAQIHALAICVELMDFIVRQMPVPGVKLILSGNCNNVIMEAIPHRR